MCWLPWFGHGFLEHVRACGKPIATKQYSTLQLPAPLAVLHRFGDVPLHHACMAQELESVQLLLE